MAIELTKMIIDNDSKYGFYYEDQDDTGSTSSSGIKFYSEFADDLVVDDNDGVYEDSLGTYTKDDDGNKVYHKYEKNLNQFTSVGSDKLSVIVSFTNGTSLILSLMSDFINGVYEDDGDDYYLKIDLTAKTFAYEPKSDYGIVQLVLPNSVMMQKMLNKDLSFETTYNETVNKIALSEDNIKSNIEISKIEIEEYLENISNANKDVIIAEIGSKEVEILNDLADKFTTTNTKIDDNMNTIIDTIDCAKSSLIALNGNSGAKYMSGQTVVIKDYNGEWNIVSSYVYKSSKKTLDVLYLVEGITNGINTDRQMLVSELVIEGLSSTE